MASHLKRNLNILLQVNRHYGQSVTFEMLAQFGAVCRQQMATEINLAVAVIGRIIIECKSALSPRSYG